FHVVGSRSPSFLLRLVIVIGGQFLDRGAENLGEQWHIGRQHGPHRQLRQRARVHRAISQVVPSLLSFTTTPILASSSRIRSDSRKSFTWRAALRAAISAVTLFSSILIEAGRKPAHSEAVSCNKPSNCALA